MLSSWWPWASDFVSAGGNDDEAKSTLGTVVTAMHAFRTMSGTTVDRRWDASMSWANSSVRGEHVFAWIKVGYIRRLARCQGVMVRRQELPKGAVHFGMPHTDVKVFSVSYAWNSEKHPDPEGSKLRELAQLLDREEADDHDLVFIDYMTLFLRPRTAAEQELFAASLGMVANMYMSARIRVIVLPRTRPGQASYLERGWPVFESVVAAYCSRLLYLREKDVEEVMTQIIEPERVIRPELLLRGSHYTNVGDAELVMEMLVATYGDMVAVPRDQTGFEQYCTMACIAWLKVATVKRFAQRPGPFPRRQELPAGSFVVGAPPRARRKFVVSHGWESEVHPSPSGRQMQQLAEVLSTSGAHDDDCVFFEHVAGTRTLRSRRCSGSVRVRTRVMHTPRGGGHEMTVGNELG